MVFRDVTTKDLGPKAKAAQKVVLGEAVMAALPPVRMAKVLKRVPGVKQFKRLYKKKTDAHPVDDRYRVWEKGQTAIFDEFDEAPDISDVHLEMMTVFRDQRGKGAGSKILKELTKMADEAGVTISLEAVPKGGPMSASQLAKWYERHGFKRHSMGDGVMVRPPSTKTVSAKGTTAKKNNMASNLRKAAEAKARKK